MPDVILGASHLFSKNKAHHDLASFSSSYLFSHILCLSQLKWSIFEVPQVWNIILPHHALTQAEKHTHLIWQILTTFQDPRQVPFLEISLPCAFQARGPLPPPQSLVLTSSFAPPMLSWRGCLHVCLCRTFLAPWRWCVVHAKSLQSCPTLYNTMDHSPPGSSVHGIF